jgi:hypothetical protein
MSKAKWLNLFFDKKKKMIIFARSKISFLAMLLSDLHSRIARISRDNASLRHYLAPFGIYPPPPPAIR